MILAWIHFAGLPAFYAERSMIYKQWSYSYLQRYINSRLLTPKITHTHTHRLNSHCSVEVCRVICVSSWCLRERGDQFIHSMIINSILFLSTLVYCTFEIYRQFSTILQLLNCSVQFQLCICLLYTSRCV